MAIVLHAMLWPDEIRDPSSLLPAPVEVSQEEIDGALALMDTMTVEDLTGPGFEDEYTRALSEIIVAKREHREPLATPEPDQPEGVLDLMAALNASVARARESRDDGTPADIHERANPKKAARKTPAKKTAAKKTAAKKTPRKSPRVVLAGSVRQEPATGPPSAAETHCRSVAGCVAAKLRWSLSSDDGRSIGRPRARGRLPGQITTSRLP